MRILIFLTIFFLGNYLYSQVPGIQWQNALGGNSTDDLAVVHQTADGGYITAGNSYSGISGEKTVPHIGPTDYLDIWIVKLSSIGTIEWQKTIGGNSHEYFSDIIQTSDGGFIVASGSESDHSIYKSEDNLGVYGTSDCWIVKLDAEGNIEWENTIGGTAHDFAESAFETIDGGYIIGAVSYSGISGDKTEAIIGGADYWIIKLSSTGNIEWQNSIGGTDTESLSKVIQLNDGNYLVGGISLSGLSGDKTEENFGGSDYWILKLDGLGNILWQNSIGANATEYLKDADQTADNGFIVAGYSSSGISFDKSEASLGSFDYWIVKLDTIGNILWQNTIGGSAWDACRSIYQTNEGGYILAGYSSSGISGDKTETFYDGGYSDADYWIIKLNSNGDIVWQNTIGGFSSETPYTIEQTNDFGYIIGGHSSSSTSADKTDPGNGSFDFWIIKLEPDCAIIPETCNLIDDNCNGLIDEGVMESISITADGTTTFCQGSSVLINATFSGTSVQWQKNGSNIPGATLASYTVTTKGNYTCVTTSDCGTATSETIFVNVFKNPSAAISAAGPTTFCVGGSVTLNVSPVAGSSYQWYKDASAIPGATSTNYIATTAGIYKCRVTKTATGCFKTSAGITVTVPCKDGESINHATAFTIYPNPNNGTFTIADYSLVNQSGHIEIYNAIGQQIFKQDITATQSSIEIQLSNISSGIYIIKLRDGVNTTKQKVIIE